MAMAAAAASRRAVERAGGRAGGRVGGRARRRGWRRGLRRVGWAGFRGVDLHTTTFANRFAKTYCFLPFRTVFFPDWKFEEEVRNIGLGQFIVLMIITKMLKIQVLYLSRGCISFSCPSSPKSAPRNIPNSTLQGRKLIAQTYNQQSKFKRRRQKPNVQCRQLLDNTQKP